MKNNKKVQWITRTGVFVALLIVLQAVTAGFGNTLITGSIVNMLLVTAVMTSGLSSGITVALISPVAAKLLGIGPLWAIIPFVALGNITLVLLWHFIGHTEIAGKKYISYFVALITGALGKFLVLYLGIVKLAVPVILELPDPQAGVVSAMFSVPQLITALIGGVIAILIFPRLNKAMNK